MIMVLGPTKKKADARAEKAADRRAGPGPRRGPTPPRRPSRPPSRPVLPPSSRPVRPPPRSRPRRGTDRGRVVGAAGRLTGRTPSRTSTPSSTSAPSSTAAPTRTDEENPAVMPKNKTHSGTKKRFRLTGSGKVMREQANRRHLFEGKPRSAPAPCPRRRGLQRRRQEGQRLLGK